MVSRVGDLERNHISLKSKGVKSGEIEQRPHFHGSIKSVHGILSYLRCSYDKEYYKSS